MSTGNLDPAELTPLARRQVLRKRRLRLRKQLAGAAVVALALSAAGVALTRHDGPDSDAATRRTVQAGRAGDGSTGTSRGSHNPPGGTHAAATPKTSPRTTTSRPNPPKRSPSTTATTASTPRLTPSGEPGPDSTTAPATSPPVTPDSTTAPATSPPVTPDPANAGGGVDPQSPPATAPAGAQGPIRATPCAPTGPPKVQPAMADGPSSVGRWVTVGRISGNCGATSGPLTTSGVETRLMYRSDAAQFQVLLVDQSDPNSSSGYADVECRGACAAMQDVTDPAGRYQLRVLASDAPWEVLLQEFR